MHSSRSRNIRLTARIALVAALGTATALLANTAYTREASRVVGYSCPGGERFTVEYLRDHVRLRTGAGIFALSMQPSGSGEKYSDGQTVFWAKGSEARLERPGLETSSACTAQEQRL